MKFLGQKILFLSIFSAPLFAMDSAPKLKDLTPNLIAKLSVAGPINGTVCASCFAPDGTHFAMGGMDYYPATLGVWNTTDYITPRLKLPSQAPILSLSASPNNQELANSGFNKISFWNILTGDHTIFIPNPDDHVQSTDYNNDGSLLLVANNRGTCKIWDLRTRTCTATLEGSNSPVWIAKWSPDNTQVATTSADMSARIFDTRTNSLMHTVDLQIPLGELAYDSTGKQLAIAAACQVLLYDPKVAQVLAKYTLKGKKFPINEAVAAKINTGEVPLMANPIQFVPGHDDVLIAGMDYGDVTIYDLQNDENSIHFKSAPDFEPGKSSDVSTIAIAPNAQLFVAGSWIGETNAWDLREFLKNRSSGQSARVEQIATDVKARSCNLQ